MHAPPQTSCPPGQAHVPPVQTAPAPFLIGAFSIWNGSIDVMNTHGLSLSLYGQNLFNALGITGGLDPGEAGPPPTNERAAHYFVSRPRTIGLHVGYKF